MKGGLFIGKGFRWHGGHTQLLEAATTAPCPWMRGRVGGFPRSMPLVRLKKLTW
jgi:hypothetical protein